MTIDNIALVRATNVIPFDGVMKPISEEFYLTKNTNLEFSRAIEDMLKEEGIIPKFDFSKFGDDEYVNSYNKMASEIAGDYIPYNSDYNSMVLFSLNGIVPDDSEKGFANNTFSNKKCAVIDGLSEHIDRVISLMPTDTAVKGSISLSENAIVLIEERYYESLSDEIKTQLGSSNFTVKTFTGSLKDAISTALKGTERFVPEELSLTRQDKGFKDSSTKDEFLQVIDNVARERGIAQVLHFDVLTGQNDDVDKLSSVQDEFDNIMLVNDYYQRQFYDYLFSYMSVDEGLKQKLMSNMHAVPYMEELCLEIKKFGIDKYKEIVKNYNEELEMKQKAGELLTPQEIVDGFKRSR